MINPFDDGYYTEDDLKNAGFKVVGKNVRIDKNCRIVGIGNIEIGDNVRIDAYCTIAATGQGYLRVGSFVHVGSHCHLSAGSGIVLEDFIAVAGRLYLQQQRRLQWEPSDQSDRAAKIYGRRAR